MIVVDNKIQVAKIKLAYIITFLIGILLLIYPYFMQVTKIELLFSIIFGSALIITFIYLLLIKPQYAYFSVENNTKIIVRNYNAFPFFRKYKAFEVKIASIQDYEIRYSFFNQVQQIRFLVTTKNKVGKYPWISLSAVPKKDVKTFVALLNKILPPEKRKTL